jgi:hypothetical protein
MMKSFSVILVVSGASDIGGGSGSGPIKKMQIFIFFL